MKNQKLAVTVAEETKKRIKGSDATLDIMLAGFFSCSNVLLYGPPGTAKTLFSETLGNAFGNQTTEIVDGKSEPEDGNLFCDAEKLPAAKPGKKKGKVAQLVERAKYAYGRVQGTPGLEERDMIGERDIATLMKDYQEKVNWRHSLLDARVLHVDEFNRMPTPRQSALLQLMAENKASLGTHSIDVPKKAIFLTMNPNGEGTFAVDPAMYDRCAISVTPEFVTAQDMEDLVFGAPLPPMPVLGSIEELEDCWKAVQAMRYDESKFDPAARAMASAMVRSTQICKEGNKIELINFPACCANCELSEGSSVCSKSNPASARALEAVVDVASGLAYVRGDKKVTTKHVREVFPYVLRHRINLNVVDDNKVGHEFNRIKGFTAEMEASANDVIKLRAKANAGQLERSELERIKKSTKNLMVKEALPAIEKAFDEVILQRMGDLRKKTVSELKRDQKFVPEDKQDLVQAMIVAHAVLAGDLPIDPSDEDALETLSELFVNADGDSLMSAEKWDEASREAAHSDLIPGVVIQIHARLKGPHKLTLAFTTAEAGEEYRSIAAKIPGFNLMPVYTTIEKKLQKAGI